MAKLVAVYNEDDQLRLERRQLPIPADDNKIVRYFMSLCILTWLFKPNWAAYAML